MSNCADAWFLHRHMAQVMDARLAALRASPRCIVLAGADGNTSHALLKQRYTAAAFAEYDARVDFLQTAQALRVDAQNLWQKISTKLPPQYASHQMAEDVAADMLWANLSLMAQSDVAAVLANWARALKTDGVLFFTHMGPDTLKQVLAYWQSHGIAVAAPMLLDMHDLGDLLLEQGFYDPVMDMDTLNVQYASAEGLVADMRHIGLWDGLVLEDEQAAIALLARGWADGALSEVSLELVYGHALKKAALAGDEALVQFYPTATKRP